MIFIINLKVSVKNNIYRVVDVFFFFWKVMYKTIFFSVKFSVKGFHLKSYVLLFFVCYKEDAIYWIGQLTLIMSVAECLIVQFRDIYEVVLSSMMALEVSMYYIFRLYG